MRISNKIKIFRIVYLIVSAGLTLYTGYLLIHNIIVCFESAPDFNSIVNLFALLAALLFEISILLFIIRSMRSQTILMKNLVFKPDGTPFRLGIGIVSVGGLLFTALSLLLFSSAYGSNFLSAVAINIQLFIADVALIFGVNLLFTLAYFFLFRHESGTFELI